MDNLWGICPPKLEGQAQVLAPERIRGFLFSLNFDKISMSQEKT
jgi:hypothetical protein